MCSSRTEKDFRESQKDYSFYVPHGLDLRIKPAMSTFSNFSLGYAGARRNAKHIEKLQIPSVEAGDMQSARGLETLTDFISSHSHLYSVREYDRPGFKPGVKIFTAALAGACFIGSREDPETYRLLGPDYPYLARDSSVEEVRKIIDFARSTFGTELHRKALSILRDLRQEFCPARIAADLYNAIETVAFVTNDARTQRQQGFTSVAGRSRVPLAWFQLAPFR